MADAAKRPGSSVRNASSQQALAGNQARNLKAGDKSRRPSAGMDGSEQRRRRRRRKRMVVNILQGVCFFAAMSLFVMLIVHIIRDFNPDIPAQDFNTEAQPDEFVAAAIDTEFYGENLAADGFEAGDVFADDDYSGNNDDVNAFDGDGAGEAATSSEEGPDASMSAEYAASAEPAHEEQLSDTSTSTAEVPDADTVDEQTISASVPLPDLSADGLPAGDTSESASLSSTAEPNTAVVSPTPASGPVTITITATGDATLGFQTLNGGYSNFKKAKDSFGVEYFLQNFKDYFSEDDFTLVNLEGPFTASTEKRPNRPFNFRGEPDYVGILTSASVEVCNLGNNHALDYQKQGFLDTCQILEDNGIGYCGFKQEYYAQCKGHTVGFLGFNTWDHKVNDMIAEVSSAKQKCDLLIVSAHWGDEGDGAFSNETKKLGKAFVDAGADLVVGNHPHLPGAVMNYKGKYIIQVLGNFCFGGNDHPGEAVRRTAVFRQSFVLAPDGSVSDGGVDIVPGFISGHSNYNDFQPCIADAKDGLNILKGMYQASKGAFKPDEVLWLDDSYVYEQGILKNPRAAATQELDRAAVTNAAVQEADTIADNNDNNIYSTAQEAGQGADNSAVAQGADQAANNLAETLVAP